MGDLNRYKTQNEFWKENVRPFLRFCVLAGGFICIFVGILTLVSLGVLGALDSIFIIGLGWGICFRRSRACAVIAGAYYAVNQLLVRLLPVGAPQGTGETAVTYVFLALMILSIYGTFTFRSDYDEYIASLVTPSGPDSGQ